MTTIDQAAHAPARLRERTQMRMPAQARRRLLISDMLIVACWVSSAVAVALYLSSGGFSAVSDFASALESLGIVTGLIGTNLILIMLVLAARVPLIDRSVGQDAAMILHGKLGKPALLLLLAHGMALTLAYAMQNGESLVTETLSLFSGPDMPTAYLGLGLLVLVVVTSAVAVRRRLSYEVWQGIHLLSYAAVLVAVPHQLSAGAVLGAGTLQRVYWIGLYVVAFGSILVFRVAVPIVASAKHSFTVVAVERIAGDVFSIYLTGRHLDMFRAAGGQYAVWRFWSANTWWHAHPLSFSAVPNSTMVRLTIRESGSGTHAIGNVRAGTRVTFAGPYGTFTAKTRTSPYLSIIAAGIGVTPVRALLEQSSLKPGEATILLRGRDHTQTYLWDEVQHIAARTDSPVFSMTGRRSHGHAAWLSAEAAERGVSLLTVFPHLLESDLYFCGPKDWASSVLHEARALGMKPHQIHVERFNS